METRNKNLMHFRNCLLLSMQMGLARFCEVCYGDNYDYADESRKAYLLGKYSKYQADPVGVIMDLDLANFRRFAREFFPMLEV